MPESDSYSFEGSTKKRGKRQPKKKKSYGNIQIDEMARRLKMIKVGRVMPSSIGMQDQRFNFYHWIEKMNMYGIELIKSNGQIYKVK